MSTRTNAGYMAKMQGHQMEAQLAAHLGSNFTTVSGTKKTDITNLSQSIRISLKNSDSAHTQIALIGQPTFATFLHADADSTAFIKLFFGFADHTPLNANKVKPYGVDFASLHPDNEVNRNRVLSHNIPQHYTDAFLHNINHASQNADFFEKIVTGNSNILAWVHTKNSLNGIRFAFMVDVLKALKGCTWKIASSHSVLDLTSNKTNKRLMYLQMKGSSARFSPGYHSCMFHMYKDVMDLVQSTSNLQDLISTS
jgi:hypothetical protein